MTDFNRRQFGLMLGASAATLAMPYVARAHTNAHVVVIGGGAGGATAARYLAKDSGGALKVTLIDPAQKFTTCFFSNLYLGGYRSFNSITHSYDNLVAAGVDKINAKAVGFGKNDRYIRLDNSDQVFFGKLVVSPGIDIKYVSDFESQ